MTDTVTRSINHAQFTIEREVPVAPADDTTEADDVPDTDEAGTGRQGASQSGTVHPEHSAPEESPG